MGKKKSWTLIKLRVIPYNMNFEDPLLRFSSASKHFHKAKPNHIIIKKKKKKQKPFTNQTYQ